MMSNPFDPLAPMHPLAALAPMHPLAPVRPLAWLTPFHLLALLAGILLGTAARAQASWPPNVSDTAIGQGWNQPVGLCFAPDGRAFVWEKAGRVWNVENGVKAAAPLINISDEVGDWRDYGLLGFAIDPSFAVNGYIYLLYVVDYYHLTHAGLPGYNPNLNAYYHDTIGRLTRYTCDPLTGYHSVVSASRTVLIGETMQTGFPICHQSHGIGTLLFGADGTLLVSCGDGASYDTVDTGGPTGGSSNTALSDGIIRPAEDVGAFRAQLVDGHNGKILRVDPATGDGVPSNPFFAASAPRAPRSRVWALGLRNPYRMVLRPGTGSPDPTAADPGTLYIGDVGWNSREELDVCTRPGQNFGWPIYEGLTEAPSYATAQIADRDAPNPLNGTGGCTQAFFTFRNLLVQDTLAIPSWPNPCNTSLQVPSNLPRFEHTRPAIDWSHAGGARTKIYNGNDAAVIDVGAAGSPVQGPQFGGHCSICGTWYTGTNAPPEFQGTLILADHVEGWMYSLACDAAGSPRLVQPFGSSVDTVVAAAVDPSDGALCFIDYDAPPDQALRRLLFVSNAPPVAVAACTPAFGPAPLSVQFTGSGSTDPESQPLSYLWIFGDGGRSTLRDPVHVYDTTDDITAQGTIIARVFSLVPPYPLGAGNPDPEVVRDNDWPPAGSQDSARQYDTYHGGDQGLSDWIGYAFGQPHEMRSITFQEGRQFFSGGWFATLRVQVGDGSTWSDVSGLTITPAYPGGNGLSFETFELAFNPVAATHIRLFGQPGGGDHFISVGELRVRATVPSGASAPLRRDVTLTVTDPLHSAASAHLVVSINNTPPQVAITSPIDGSRYSMTASSTVSLSANVSDAEHGPAELACAWQTILHHDEHTHPEPIDTACATTSVITPVGCDGNLYFYELSLTVGDAAGLSTQASVFVYPDCCASSGPPGYCMFCSGDGSGTACPCSPGASGNGCPNSLNEYGAHLAGSGLAQVGADTLSLQASGMPDSTALYFQGTDVMSGGSGTLLGDGLLCLSGELVRLRTKLNAGGASSFPESGDPSVSVRGMVPAAGGLRRYQVWYRNAAAYCTSATFNCTNGLEVTWVP